MRKELTKKIYSLKSLSDTFAQFQAGEGKEEHKVFFKITEFVKLILILKKKRWLTFQCRDNEETGRSEKRSHALKPFSLPENWEGHFVSCTKHLKTSKFKYKEKNTALFKLISKLFPSHLWARRWGCGREGRSIKTWGHFVTICARS